MAITKEQQQDSDKAYQEAFNETPAAPVGQTEDEAFGITADEPAAVEGEGDPAAAAEPAADAPAADAAEVGSQTAEEGAGEPAPVASDEPRADDATTVSEEPASMTPEQIKKEEQRLRSWEGRLKAMERERGAAPARAADESVDAEDSGDGAAAEPAVAEAAEGELSSDPAEAVAEVAEQVESGEMTPEQAVARLSEDFGEDFVKMIQVIAGSTASKTASESVDSKVGEIKGAVDEIIADITDTKSRQHFEAIAAKHPDFTEIGGSEGFASYIAGLPEADQAEAKRVASGGSASEIVALLDAYKKSGAQAEPEAAAPAADPVIDPEVDAQMDAAEGVRSSGMRLPEQPPAAASSYEDAWEQAS